jgi:hypothetical protein
LSYFSNCRGLFNCWQTIRLCSYTSNSSTFNITCWYDHQKIYFFIDLKIFFSDFFDSGSSKSQIDTNKSITKSALPTTNTVTPSEDSSAIPEGFFDDPQVDARMRKVEYVDKMEVEWDAFTREMKQETNV